VSRVGRQVLEIRVVFFIVSIYFSQQFEWSMRGVGTGVLRTQKTNVGGLGQDEGL